MRNIVMRRTDYTVAPITVTQRQRNHFFHHAMPCNFLRLFPGDVAGRHIEVINRRQDDLHRTAFGANHQINAAGVALHAVL